MSTNATPNAPLTKPPAPQRTRRSRYPLLESKLYSQQRPIISTLVSSDASPQCVPQYAAQQASGSTEEAPSLHGYSKTRKRKRQAENGDSEVNLAIDANDGSSSGRTGNASGTSWIGNMILAPAGERGRGTNAHGRLGFNNDDILSQPKVGPVYGK